MIRLYKRNAQGKPVVWQAEEVVSSTDPNIPRFLNLAYGLVGGHLHEEEVVVTAKKVNELKSRINAKRKEGYKELSELKDSSNNINFIESGGDFDKDLIRFLDTYLPKYSTTSEGFTLPMLAKVLEDNKPFDKYGDMLGQWKINGLRCIIGATEKSDDIFNPISLTYHSRIGEDWTNKMCWMDEILLPKISSELLDMMIEEGVCLDGELYLPGYSVNEINSFVKNVNLVQHKLLQYWCYDICVENMSAGRRNEFRRNNINVECWGWCSDHRHLNNKEQFVSLPSVVVHNIDNAINKRNEFIDCGFEGLILRNPAAEYQFGKRNQAMFKFKKIDDGKFVIVDIKSEHKRSNLPLFVLRNDINSELFECSINKPQDVQRKILNDKDEYIGKYMVVEFRERSGVAKVPFHARGINIVNDK